MRSQWSVLLRVPLCFSSIKSTYIDKEQLVLFPLSISQDVIAMLSFWLVLQWSLS